MNKLCYILVITFSFSFFSAAASGEDSLAALPPKDSSIVVQLMHNKQKIMSLTQQTLQQKQPFLDYIQNQNSSAQDGSFWIGGNGYINGNMGVGTSIPSSKLTIAGVGGVFTLTDNETIQSINGFSSTKTLKIINTESNGVPSLAHFDANNNTTRPQLIVSNSSSGQWENNFLGLAVHGSSFSYNGQNDYYLNDGTSDAGLAILWSQGSNVSKFAVGTANPIPLSFFTNNQERLIISNSGDVAVGSSMAAFMPQTRLGVYKNDHVIMELAGVNSSRINFRDNSQGINNKVWEVLNWQGNFSINRISDDYGTRTDKFSINSNGTVKINSLAGNGTGYVAVDNGGNLSWTPGSSGGGTSGTWLLGGNQAVGTDFIGTTNNSPLIFKSNNVEGLRIISSGQIGIGVGAIASFSDAGYKLFVEGGVRARKVKVDASGWSDYVFYPNYNLPSLKEVEQFIKVHQHLPEVPSAEEVKKEGIDVAETQATLLKKIEELTLYIIEQENKQVEQQKEIEILKKKSIEFEELKKEMEQLKKLIKAN